MRTNRFQFAAAMLACAGMMLPTTGLAAAPQAAPSNDVALRDGGLLVGQVVDLQGRPRAEAEVSVQFEGKEVARTTTDKNGIFATKGLRGGQYFLITDQGQSSYRLWAPRTAPPSAQPTALLVEGGQIVRGNYYYGTPVLDWMRCHPYLTAGIIATAIAIPIVVADDDDNS